MNVPFLPRTPARDLPTSNEPGPVAGAGTAKVFGAVLGHAIVRGGATSRFAHPTIAAVAGHRAEAIEMENGASTSVKEAARAPGDAPDHWWLRIDADHDSVDGPAAGAASAIVFGDALRALVASALDAGRERPPDGRTITPAKPTLNANPTMAMLGAATGPIAAVLRAATDPVTTATLVARKTEAKSAAGKREARPAPDTTAAPDAPAARPATPSVAPSSDSRPVTTSPSTAAIPVQAPLPAPPARLEVAGGVLRSAAHLKVDAGPLGAVDLHLRMRDGALHLRVDGDAAHLVEGRQVELSRALAREGLELGSIELPRPDAAPPAKGDAGRGAGGNDGRGAGQGEARRQGWEEAANARAGATHGSGTAARSPRPKAAHDGSIDVQA